MEHKDEMIEEMKNAIIETFSKQMEYGWSFDQVEGLFIVAARKALDQLRGE